MKNISYEQQQQYIKTFDNNKSQEEKENIKSLVDKFIGNKEITKAEYNQLIQYYKGTDLINFLKYNTYKISKYNHMNDKEVGLHSIIFRSCFILNY